MDWLNVLKHFGYSILSVAVVAVVGYFTDAAGLTKALTDLGVNPLYVGIAVPAFHAIAVAIQNFLKSIAPAE